MRAARAPAPRREAPEGEGRAVGERQGAAVSAGVMAARAKVGQGLGLALPFAAVGAQGRGI